MFVVGVGGIGDVCGDGGGIGDVCGDGDVCVGGGDGDVGHACICIICVCMYACVYKLFVIYVYV